MTSTSSRLQSPKAGPAPTLAIAPEQVLGRVAALQKAPVAELKAQWRTLFGAEPPAFSRTYLRSRLAYRIQELAYGGLKPDAFARLEALGEQLDENIVGRQRVRADLRPLAGTRLVRKYQGVEHVVTVRPDGSPSRAGPTGRCPRSPVPLPAHAGTAWCSSA